MNVLSSPASQQAGYLSDAEWTRIEPALPPQRPPAGRPAHDHRTIVSGILWVQRTGEPWRRLPRKYGSWSTVASRYHRWKKAGIWDRVQAALAQQQAMLAAQQTAAALAAPTGLTDEKIAMKKDEGVKGALA